jgi:hypothetical protein
VICRSRVWRTVQTTDRNCHEFTDTQLQSDAQTSLSQFSTRVGSSYWVASCTHSALDMGLTLYLAWNCEKPPWSTMTSWSMSLPCRMLCRVSAYICEDTFSTRSLVTMFKRDVHGQPLVLFSKISWVSLRNIRKHTELEIKHSER